MNKTADFLIVGLGKTGLSVARFLAARGQSFAVADSRINPPGLFELRAECPQAAIHLGPFDADHFCAYPTLVVSPGVATSEPAIQAAARAGAEIIGDIELFARHAKAPVIAITGSNGKSTVTTLVGELLAAAGRRVGVGGNLGTPALDLLAGPSAEAYVLELSSFQLETTEGLAPAAGTVLNVSPDHMDRYPDLAAYAAAKGRIHRGSALAVVNRDDPWSLRLAEAAPRSVSFGLDAPAAGQWGIIEHGGAAWLARGGERLVREGELALRGRHNMANALAALALVEALGVEGEAVLDALRRFAGLPHRSQYLGRFAGMDWINDSKGTNVGATAAALAGQRAPVVLIAGGLGKGQDFRPLRPLLAEKARAVLLLGEATERLAEDWAGTVPLLRVDDLDEAIEWAARVGRPGDTVLLSPACASFDMFQDYAQRGEAFAAALRRRFGPC